MKDEQLSQAIDAVVKEPCNVNLVRELLNKFSKERRPVLIFRCSQLCPSIPYFQVKDKLDACLLNKELWHQARDIFDETRDINIEQHDPRIKNYLSLLERSAKLLYNLTEPQGPFDKGAGLGFTKNLAAIVEIEELSRILTTVFCSEH